MKVYYGNYFSDKSDMISEFNLDEIEAEAITPLFAYYGNDGSVGGECFVLFLKAGQLYEVSAQHCSCYGIEGQWEPDITSKAALKMIKWDFCDTEANEALQKIIDLLPD